MIMVYTTCKNDREAHVIAKSLLQKRLVACANVFPVNSLFWWKGKIEETVEKAIIMKTKKKNFENVRKEIKRLHSYETPCIVAINIYNADSDYLKWLKEEVR